MREKSDSRLQVKKGAIIPTGILIPQLEHSDSYKTEPEPVIKPPTINDYRKECKKRKLKASGTKKELIKRIEEYDKKMEEIKKEELKIVKKYDKEKIEKMEEELTYVRNDISREYGKLAHQQNLCTKLDKEAEKLRANIQILKENL